MKFLLLLLLLFPRVVNAQAIKTLADSLSAGQWGQLTGVTDQALRNGESVTGEHLTYAHSAQWEPNSHNGYFVGAGHGVNTAPWLFKYTSITNTWTKLLELQPLGLTPLHNYDHTSFDSQRRRLYIRDTNRVYGFDTTADTWLGLLTNAPYDLGNIAEGTAWFDGFGMGGGFLVYSGENPSFTQAHVWEPSKGTGSGAWSEINSVIVPGPSSSNYHTWSEYSHVYNVTFVGGGNNQPRKVAVIRPNQLVESVPDAPVDIRIQGANAVIEPSSGKLLVYGLDQMWELGRNTIDTAWVWRQLSVPANITEDSALGDPGEPGAQRSIMSMSIAEYGVVYYVRCQGFNPCRHYLYKHTGAVTEQPPAAPQNLQVE